MQELPHTHSCFVCGESNPLGLHLRFHTDGRSIHAEFTPRIEHIGFKQVVHGGIIATVLDEIMVWACAVPSKRFGFCAELTVRYHQPLRPGEKAVAQAELVSNRRNRIFAAKAELRNSEGVLLASATGKYLPIHEQAQAELKADMVGDAEDFKLP